MKIVAANKPFAVNVAVPIGVVWYRRLEKQVFNFDL